MKEDRQEGMTREGKFFLKRKKRRILKKEEKDNPVDNSLVLIPY